MVVLFLLAGDGPVKGTAGEIHVVPAVVVGGVTGPAVDGVVLYYGPGASCPVPGAECLRLMAQPSFNDG